MSKKKILSMLAPKMPSFALKGNALWAGIGSPVLRGFYFESSRFDKMSFRLRAVIIPIFTGSGVVSYQFSRELYRARGEIGLWRFNFASPAEVVSELEEVLRGEGLQYLQHGETIESFLALALERVAPKMNPHDECAIGYSYAYLGDRANAVKWLEGVARRYLDNPPTEWTTRLSLQTGRLLAAVLEGPEATRQLLDQWSRKARSDLKLVEAPTA